MNDYFLMWKDHHVLTFNLKEQKISEVNHKLLPLAIAKKPVSIGTLRIYMASRVLQTNREHCKEILTSCNIEDQTDENICLVSKGLSFRDNYWFKKKDEQINWNNINLYHNPFSTEIAYTSLTGESSTTQIGDDIYTGELTGKGTRSKCFFRQNDHIFLAKAETKKEIAAEYISHILLDAMHIPSATYIPANIYGKDCSVCMLNTSEDIEMFHAADLLSYYDCAMSADSKYYKSTMEKYSDAFIKMQIFDYVTLNTDRNRNNFAIERINGKYTGLYPLYDHDSCFKDKSENGIYFPTGKSFADTINILKSYSTYEKIIPDIKCLYDFMRGDGKMIMNDNGFADNYDGVMTRLEKSLDYPDQANNKRFQMAKEELCGIQSENDGPETQDTDNPSMH